MRWPESLAARVGFALVLALLGIVALAWAVDAFERDRAPRRRPSIETAPAGEARVVRLQVDPAARTVVEHAEAEPVEARPRAVEPARSDASRIPSLAAGGRIAMARRVQSLAPDIAPVVEVLPDGSLVLRRSAPLPSGPLPAATRSHDGFAAALLLPGELDELGPRGRAALLAVLRRWLPERPVSLARLRPIDLRWSEREFVRLLSWLP